METIELLDSDSDSEYDVGTVDPQLSRVAHGKGLSSGPQDISNQKGQIDTPPSSDSTITRESQVSTNASGVRVKSARAAQVEITIFDSDSSMNDGTPCTKNLSTRPSLQPENKRNNAIKDQFDLQSESSSSQYLVKQNTSKATAKYNFQSDSDSDYSPLFQPPAKKIAAKDCRKDFQLHSESDDSSLDLKSKLQPSKQQEQQKKSKNDKKESFNLDSGSESPSSQSQPLKRTTQRSDHDMFIVLNSSNDEEDEDYDGDYDDDTRNRPVSLPQKQALSKVVTATLDTVSKGCTLETFDSGHYSDTADKSLIVLESSTDEEKEPSTKWVDSKPSSTTDKEKKSSTKWEDSKPSPKPNMYASYQSSDKPGTKKRPRKSDDSSDSSDDSLLHFQNPFSTQTSYKREGSAGRNTKAVQQTIELASSPDVAPTSKVSSSREVKSKANLKMADYDNVNDSDGKFTQESALLSDMGSKLPYNPYKSKSTNPSASTTSSDTTNVVQPASNAKDDVPTPALPSVNIIGGRLYPDLRHQCIKSLISHAKVLRRAIHQRGALDASIRAIILLAFYPYPLRSPEAVANLKGIGTELLVVFNDMMKACSKEKTKPYCPPRGKFSSVAAASLIALDDYEREEKGKVLCSMEDLITRINSICHNPTAATHVFDRDAEYYLNKENIDPGWLQIRKLCAGNESLIKERKKKTSCASGILFELTDQGRAQVQVLRRIASCEPVPPGPLRQLASSFVDKAYGSVTMSMDIREGGGDTKGLHKMCNLLDEYRVPYVVRHLKISDYIFFVGDKLAPILIERKSIDDVAGSLFDDRWGDQQIKMRKAQYVLGKGEERRCQICYIIEGEAGKRVVHGGAIARTSWDVNLEQVENAVATLPKLGFSVMKSKSHMGTMNILSQIARDIWWKYKNGSIDCLLTYEEFLQQIDRCPDNIGDPPTRTEHMNPVAPVVDAVSGSLRVSHVNNDNGVDSRRGVSAPSSPSSDRSDDGTDKRNKERAAELEKLSLAELKELCIERQEKVSGTKKDLIDRLLQERKPEILLTRARRNQYVPKLPSSNAALLVALLLNHTPGTEGLPKERLMLLAEETGVSKDPMGGKGGWYDGWSGMKEMTTGDPPLVSVVKRKYSLTTQPTGGAGIDVAKALHTMAHRENICRCGSFKI